MPIYVYESIPSKPGEEPRHFEFLQQMNDEPYVRHPETGEPIRRVVLGNFGVLTSRDVSGRNAGGGAGPCCGPDSQCC